MLFLKVCFIKYLILDILNIGLIYYNIDLYKKIYTRLFPLTLVPLEDTLYVT